jgi:hypothetical protein
MQPLVFTVWGKYIYLRQIKFDHFNKFVLFLGGLENFHDVPGQLGLCYRMHQCRFLGVVVHRHCKSRCEAWFGIGISLL